MCTAPIPPAERAAMDMADTRVFGIRAAAAPSSVVDAARFRGQNRVAFLRMAITREAA